MFNRKTKKIRELQETIDMLLDVNQGLERELMDAKERLEQCRRDVEIRDTHLCAWKLAVLRIAKHHVADHTDVEGVDKLVKLYYGFHGKEYKNLKLLAEVFVKKGEEGL